MPHNLRIVDYVIGVPGSVHDSNAFAKARIARHPQTFLGGNEWIWADSAYGARPWCVVPFKRPAAGGLTGNQKTFNYHLSKVRVRSEHCFGSLKGRFQSLRELRVQIQAQKDLDEVNMWTRCCFILHNMIVDIEEQLGGTGTFDHFAEEARQWGHRVQDSGEGDEDDAEQEGAGDEGFIGSQGQIFRNTLMGQLLRDFNQHTLNSSSVHHNV
ncbi:hypothetical protein BDR04DRAFT_1033251 [Suillus decipiens]|nr:hypothetical protein BDR04DRAFT_1033251 [Suillus decipiens]